MLSKVVVFIFLSLAITYRDFLKAIADVILQRELADAKEFNKVEEVVAKLPVKLPSIRIFHSKYPFSAAVQIPTMIVVSDKLVKLLDKKELQYILLHELGNLHGYHPLMMLGYFVSSTLAFAFIQPSWFFVIVMSIINSLVALKLHRVLEEEADTFALEHLEDSQYMIDAVKKLAKFHKPKRESSLQELFALNSSYDYRIKRAKYFYKKKRKTSTRS